jgi:predicted aconitase with swiveling domain
MSEPMTIHPDTTLSFMGGVDEEGRFVDLWLPLRDR